MVNDNDCDFLQQLWQWTCISPSRCQTYLSNFLCALRLKSALENIFHCLKCHHTYSICHMRFSKRMTNLISFVCQGLFMKNLNYIEPLATAFSLFMGKKGWITVKVPEEPLVCWEETCILKIYIKSPVYYNLIEWEIACFSIVKAMMVP